MGVRPKLILVFIVFLTLGFFSWNFSEFFGPDAVYFFGRRLRSLSDIASAFSALDNRGQYRPLGLVLFSFTLYPLLGYSPTGYHVIPLLFHLANVLLVYRIARELHADSKVALGAAFFFALHRCNFFVTFGLTFLPDFVGCFFFLAALLAYIKSRGAGGYILAFVLWILALGNKETVVIFPAVLLCYEWLFVGTEGRAWSKVFRRLLPFAAMSLVFVAFMLLLRGGRLYPDAAGDPYRSSLSISTLIPKVKYLWWAVNLPQGSGLANAVMPGVTKAASMPELTVAYPVHTSVSVALMLPFAVGFLIFSISRLIKRDRIAAFGLVAFFLALAPVLPLAGRVMHHNLYYSLFGLSLVMGQFLADLLQTRLKALAPIFILAFAYSTVVGVANKRQTSWPVTSARISKKLLDEFRLAAQSRPVCASGGVLIARTGDPDFVWYSDGGNLFRVFGPCPNIHIYFEDLGQTPSDPEVVRVDFEFQENVPM